MLITYFLHCDLIMHVIFLAVENTASHMKPNSPHLIAVSGSGKRVEGEDVKDGKQIVEIETGEEETNDEENEEEVKQKQTLSQNVGLGSKGIPIVPVSTDECKYECIYGLHSTYSHVDVLLILVQLYIYNYLT